MAEYNYIVTEKPVDSSGIQTPERNLLGSFSVNSVFDQSKHRVEFRVLSLEGIQLEYDSNFKRYKQSNVIELEGRGIAAKSLEIDPVEDIKYYGFENGDVIVNYRFINDLFSKTSRKSSLFIESISSDRLEFRALSQNLTESEVTDFVSQLSDKLNNSSYFSEFKVNFENGNVETGINIGTEKITKGQAIVVKLYKPLPVSIVEFSTFSIEEQIADTISFEIEATLLDQKEEIPFLKGPNFNIEVSEDDLSSTEYLNYSEIIGYPISSSNYEVFSLFNEQSANIAIDHTDYSDFIHFSSAVSRLGNFRGKMELLELYESSLGNIDLLQITGTELTGSRSYYENLVELVVNNFDHYERYLYFESSSYAWPKTNSVKPYINDSVLNSTTWYEEMLENASTYDNTNYDMLIGSIPDYIREDENNLPYLTFVNLLGHFFDNIWIYIKAVSDKYDADNRLEFGISKDLVKDAIESVGVRLYSSNGYLDNLFSYYTGETYDSGSELIVSHSVATSGSDVSYLQPVSKDDYQKEIYKRIYHNLPFLIKNKGTERGVRALLNCYGVPSELLTPIIFGGTEKQDSHYFSPSLEITGSLSKVRLNNTGSEIEGDVLSNYASTVRRVRNYSDDIHTIDLGFNVSKLTNDYLFTKLSGSFNIDNYIGDPRDRYESEYGTLKKLEKFVASRGLKWEDVLTLWEEETLTWEGYDYYYDRDIKALIRLTKFFDNSVFKSVKDFIPARSNLNSGIIIRPNLLSRSKVKQVQLEVSQDLYSGSIITNSITGSNGGTYDESGGSEKSTAYTLGIQTPLEIKFKDIVDESPRFNGELSGSNVEVLDKRNESARLEVTFNNFDFILLDASLSEVEKVGVDLISNYVAHQIKVKVYETSENESGTVIVRALFYNKTTELGEPPDYEYLTSATHGDEIILNVDFNRYSQIWIELMPTETAEPETWKYNNDSDPEMIELHSLDSEYLQGSFVLSLNYDLVEFLVNREDSNQGDGKLYATYVAT